MLHSCRLLTSHAQDVTKSNRKSKGRSLAEILGIMKEDPKKESKVPVVIDPRLGKVLRPHQVEGVKVGRYLMNRYAFLTIPCTSFYTIAAQDRLWQDSTVVSWRTKWD